MGTPRRAPTKLALLVLLALALDPVAAAGARSSHAARHEPARGERRGSGWQSAPAVAAAPSAAPLPTGSGGLQAAGGAEAGAEASPAGSGPARQQRSRQPDLQGRAGVVNSSQSSRRNCETSGFVAAPAPTGDYGLDVHIDTGVLGLSTGGLLSTVQDLFVTPLWMALVWAVHALVVMLEWCFTIDLLDSAAAAGLGSGLRQHAGGIHGAVAGAGAGGRVGAGALPRADPPSRR